MHEETLIKFSPVAFKFSRVKIACFENEGAALVAIWASERSARRRMQVFVFATASNRQ